MSFLSSIFPTSSGNPANGAPAPQSATTAAPAVIAPDPAAVAAAAAAATAAAKPTSALDAFTKMWENPTTSDGKPVAPVADPLRQPIFNFDPAKITESANKMDFMAGVDPALTAKALSGDAAAFAEVLNQAVRQAVVGVTVSSGNLINQAVVANNNRVTESIPAALRRQQLLDSTSENEVFNHPAVQPLVNSLKQMALARDPTASVQEINTMISSYLTGLATATRETSPEAIAANSATKSKEPDWVSYMGTGPGR